MKTTVDTPEPRDASFRGEGLQHDARVAGLCLLHGIRELRSRDRDFSRFPELTVTNPLVAKGDVR